jgi:hypothetical protein
MIVPTRSQSGSKYDPWTDVNGDGTIDMADISMGIEGFMSNGDATKPVNVTNWPTSQPVNVVGHATKLIKAVADLWIEPGGCYLSDAIPVDGYSKVTILITGAGGPLPYIEFEAWESSSVGKAYLFELITDYTGIAFVKTYDVMCPYIHIYIYSGVGVIVTVSFYLVA